MGSAYIRLYIWLSFWQLLLTFWGVSEEECGVHVCELPCDPGPAQRALLQAAAPRSSSHRIGGRMNPSTTSSRAYEHGLQYQRSMQLCFLLQLRSDENVKA